MFPGDGECDEPESLGAIALAGRERLGNLHFVINCNLQRLDGPVRGNGKIIQAGGCFRGAGWHVIKVVWGRSGPSDRAGSDGPAAEDHGRRVTASYRTASSMAVPTPEHFFGKYPETLELVRI